MEPCCRHGTIHTWTFSTTCYSRFINRIVRHGSRGHGKAAAKIAALGQPYYYYENIDGGHSAAANLAESARRMALEYTYASKRLVD